MFGDIEKSRAETERLRIEADREKAKMENTLQARQVTGTILILVAFGLAGVFALFNPSLTTAGEKLIFGVISFFAGWGIGKKSK